MSSTRTRERRVRVRVCIGLCAGLLNTSMVLGDPAPATGERPIGPPGGTPGIAARQIDTKRLTPASAANAKPAGSKTTSPTPTVSAGQVWVDTESRIYHCAGSKWYGKTRQGRLMTEDAAKSAGNRADHGKACAG